MGKLTPESIQNLVELYQTTKNPFYLKLLSQAGINVSQYVNTLSPFNQLAYKGQTVQEQLGKGEVLKQLDRVAERLKNWLEGKEVTKKSSAIREHLIEDGYISLDSFKNIFNLLGINIKGMTELLDKLNLSDKISVEAIENLISRFSSSSQAYKSNITFSHKVKYHDGEVFDLIKNPNQRVISIMFDPDLYYPDNVDKDVIKEIFSNAGKFHYKNVGQLGYIRFSEFQAKDLLPGQKGDSTFWLVEEIQSDFMKSLREFKAKLTEQVKTEEESDKVSDKNLTLESLAMISTYFDNWASILLTHFIRECKNGNADYILFTPTKAQRVKWVMNKGIEEDWNRFYDFPAEKLGAKKVVLTSPIQLDKDTKDGSSEYDTIKWQTFWVVKPSEMPDSFKG